MQHPDAVKGIRAALSVLVLLAGSPAPAGQEREIDFVRDVQPIFKSRCLRCHDREKDKGLFRLDSKRRALRGGAHGQAIIPGKAKESPLMQRLLETDEEKRMPKGGDPLPAGEIAVIRAWIDRGAEWPDSASVPKPEIRHWAFEKPVRPASSATIDGLIAAGRDRRGLVARPPAEPAVLLRRLTLDLIGLPPSREELRAFLRDPSPEAYERIVDQLLTSPHYGERWGRHWMDVWRYSDWHGLGAQVRYSQKHVWHWRDWILESLNADKGYDRMVLEMLAADEIAPTDRDALRATGYLVRSYFIFNRTTWLDSTIEHTSRAFLGLTMQCAKCHDHKYDPVTQDDYYRLRAVFEPHQVRLDPMPGVTDLEKDGLPRAFDAQPEAPTYIHRRGNEKDPIKDHPMEPGVPVSLGGTFRPEPVALPPDAHLPGLQAFVLEDRLRESENEIRAARATLKEAERALAETPAGDKNWEEAKSRVACAVKRLAAAELGPKALRAVRAADLARSRGAASADLDRAAARLQRRHALVRAEADLLKAEQDAARADAKKKAAAQKVLKSARDRLKKARAAMKAAPEKYDRLRASRKAPDSPAETEASIRKPYPKTSTGRRTALARWIVDRSNPLAARVAVNHIWLRHFGQPLVPTMSDFGTRAPAPPQQALLDFLAVEFMDDGWSMKRLHRRIVTSETYKLSSSTAGADPATAGADPENHYYWRRLPMRMESQIVRDSVLKLAGLLDPALGGPTIDPKKKGTTYRRSLYFTHSKNDRHKFLSMFDDADTLECYRRAESILPQEALAMANSRLMLEAAGKTSARLHERHGEMNDDRFIDLAFESILSTAPTAPEKRACREALQRLRRASKSASRAREILVHALMNHNDFVTIR